MYAPNNRMSKYKGQKLMEQVHCDSKCLECCLSEMDRSSGQVSKDAADLGSTIKQPDERHIFTWDTH